MNVYLKKSSQNLVHYLSCQAVRCTAYINVCCDCMMLTLSLGFARDPWPRGLGLGLKIWALTTLLHFCDLEYQFKVFRGQNRQTRTHKV